MKVQFKLLAAVAATCLAAGSVGAAEDASNDPSATALTANLQGYSFQAAPDRFTVYVHKSKRFTTVPIDHAKLIEFCSDLDGCQMRMGMHDWDETGRIASREFLFFFNKDNGNWRASLGDAAGSDKNNVVQHVNNSWACYMTDGTYVNQASNDSTSGFGLLSWTQYNASCVLTIID